MDKKVTYFIVSAQQSDRLATEESTMKIGFIGPGQMGRPMIDRLCAAGHVVTVHARRPETQQSLRWDGLTALPRAVDVVQDAELVIVCVFSDDQLGEVMIDDGALGAMAKNSILVNHVTGSPTTARALQSRAPSGVTVLDAPVSGTAHDIRAGRLTILTGGNESAFADARTALSAYGDPIVHVGDLGSGQLVKLLNNLVFSANLRAACDAAVLAERLGIEHQTFVDAITHCSGDSTALHVLAAGRPDAITDGIARYLRKDVAAAREASRDLGVDLGRLAEWADWFSPGG